jgi:hypothetical protein
VKTTFRFLPLLYAALLLNIVACHKDPMPTITPKSIVGKWKWISTWKGIPPSETNPLTPKNTGIEELLVFNADNTWYKTENLIKVDSGNITTGHRVYINPSNSRFEYDSICYYRNGNRITIGDYYEIDHDTLLFCSYSAGRWFSYTLQHSGTKRWVKVR